MESAHLCIEDRWFPDEAAVVDRTGQLVHHALNTVRRMQEHWTNANKRNKSPPFINFANSHFLVMLAVIKAGLCTRQNELWFLVLRAVGEQYIIIRTNWRYLNAPLSLVMESRWIKIVLRPKDVAKSCNHIDSNPTIAPEAAERQNIDAFYLDFEKQAPFLNGL